MIATEMPNSTDTMAATRISAARIVAVLRSVMNLLLDARAVRGAPPPAKMASVAYRLTLAAQCGFTRWALNNVYFRG